MADNLMNSENNSTTNYMEASAAREAELAQEALAREVYERKLAEAQAANAALMAQQAQMAAQQADAERRALRTELYTEQERANSSSFGTMLLLAFVLAGLVIGGFFLWGRTDRTHAAEFNVQSGTPVPVQRVTIPR